MRLKNAIPTVRRSPLSPAGLCNAVIEAGTLIAIIIAPLYFNPRTEHTFEPDKAALLRSVMLIALLTWVIKMNFEFRTLRQAQGGVSNFEIGLLRTPIVLPALLLLTAYVIGTATSVLPRVSFWGSYERGQGLYTLVAYIILFFLIRETLGTPAQQQRLLDVILLVSVPISVYALLQHFGLDPLNFRTGGAAVTVRAISTLGNPIFLGAYLIMVIPLTLLRAYQFWQPGVDSRTNPGWAGIYGALLILQLAALFFAQSRGPTLGLIGGLGFGTILWVARRQVRRVLAGITALAALGIAVIGLMPALAPGTTNLGPLGDLADPTSRTGRQRLLVWEGTVDLATADPARTWIGHGPETLRDMVGPRMPAEIAGLKPDEDFDRAHNAVLDLWATAGLLGVAAYLLVIGAVMYYGLRVLGLVSGARSRRLFLALTAAGTLLGGLVPWLGVGRQWVGVGLPVGLLSGVGAFVVWQGLGDRRRCGPLSGDELLVVALLAGVVAHVVETLVGIAIVATQTLFWVYAGLIATLSRGAEEQRSRGDKGTRGQEPALSPSKGDKRTRRGREVTLSPPHPLSPSPPLPGSVWGLVTGITLALFSFPLLTAGQARGGLAWGVTASATLLFGLLRLLPGSTDTDEPVVRYIGIAVGAVLVFSLLGWLPWPPLDITHTTVATFIYVVFALPVLAGALIGVDLSFDRLSTGFRDAIAQAAWWRLLVYGVLAVGTLAAIWLSNVQPMRADVFYKEGLGLSAAGNVQKAAQFLERSVALDPWEDRYRSGVGAAYAQMAQATAEPDRREDWLSEAETHLQEAQRLDPYRADHLRNLGVLHRIWADFGAPTARTSHLQQALVYYEQAAMRNPVNVRVWREWGETHAALGEWDAAVQRYDESLRLNDSFVETWLLLAEAQLHLADYDAALQAYTRALALDETRVLNKQRAAVDTSPDDPLPHQALALVYTVLGQSQAARAEAEAARDLMGEEPPVWGKFLEALE